MVWIIDKSILLTLLVNILMISVFQGLHADKDAQPDTQIVGVMFGLQVRRLGVAFVLALILHAGLASLLCYLDGVQVDERHARKDDWSLVSDENLLLHVHLLRGHLFLDVHYRRNVLQGHPASSQGDARSSKQQEGLLLRPRLR